MKSLEHPIKLDEPQVSVVENETQRILRDALGRLGPNGENWLRGWDFKSGCRECAIEAVRAISRDHANPFDENANNARGYLNRAALILLPDSADDITPLFRVNGTARDFSEVRAMFDLAIELAGTHAPQGAA